MRPPASAADEPDTLAELKSRALRLLARREHSRAELARKLSGHAARLEDVEAVLEALTARNLLSDERYAEQRTLILARKFGAGRIRRELLAKGVSAEQAERAVSGDDELARACAILQKKYRDPAASREERAKRARFLQGRGFSFEVIRRALLAADDEEQGA